MLKTYCVASLTNKVLHFVIWKRYNIIEEFRLLRARGIENQAITDYEDVPIACCRVDEAGLISRCNEIFAFLLGFQIEELQRVSLYDLLSGEVRDQLARVINNSNGNLGTFSQHVWLKRKDGSTFPAIVNMKLVLDGKKRLKFGNIVVIDDTFNYKAIEDIAKDKEELRKRERLKNEFVAIASHELRTPIQPILGFALLAKRKTISEEAAWEGVLGEARRLQQLANDILDVSRIESDNIKYEFVKVRINELLRHTVDSLATEASQVSISVEHDPSENDLVIDADRSRITQVITNVVGNAIKFTAKGSINIRTRALGGFVEISVADSGRGISPEILPKLFEKFATKDHGEGTKKGTGLGLYISKAIVTAHKGTITALNNKDGGATFLITLPISH